MIKKSHKIRHYLVATFLVLADDIPLPIIQKQESVTAQKEPGTICALQDLMQEHGALDRLLLIYEAIIKQIEADNFQKLPLAKAVAITQMFIENYHEKLEEDYIFPIFEKQQKEVRLVKTLRNQHIKGREVTTRLQQILKSPQPITARKQQEIVTLLKKFIKMYRPHAAREDTVLFPKVDSMISAAELKKLSITFEELEEKLFGKNGFGTIIKKIEAIEKELGIYTLDQFTPQIRTSKQITIKSD